MIRLVTKDGKPVPVVEIKNDANRLDPQELLDSLCEKCFLQRRHYINFVSDRKPFDKVRAHQIKEILIAKGLTDPRSFALGQAIRSNWHRFEGLD